MCWFRTGPKSAGCGEDDDKRFSIMSWKQNITEMLPGRMRQITMYNIDIDIKRVWSYDKRDRPVSIVVIDSKSYEKFELVSISRYRDMDSREIEISISRCPVTSNSSPLTTKEPISIMTRYRQRQRQNSAQTRTISFRFFC